MPKVKALYHFLDTKACRNRKQGDVFDAPDKIAEELAKAGFVVILEPKVKTDIKLTEKTADPPAEQSKKQAQIEKEPKKQKK